MNKEKYTVVTGSLENIMHDSEVVEFIKKDTINKIPKGYTYEESNTQIRFDKNRKAHSHFKVTAVKK